MGRRWWVAYAEEVFWKFLSGLMELEKRNRSSVTVKLGKMKSSSCVFYFYFLFFYCTLKTSWCTSLKHLKSIWKQSSAHLLFHSSHYNTFLNSKIKIKLCPSLLSVTFPVLRIKVLNALCWQRDISRCSQNDPTFQVQDLIFLFLKKPVTETCVAATAVHVFYL